MMESREIERDKDPQEQQSSWLETRIPYKKSRSLQALPCSLKGPHRARASEEGMALLLHCVLLCVGERCNAISGARLCVDNWAPTAKKMLCVPFHRWGHSGSETVNNSGRIQIYSVKPWVVCTVSFSSTTLWINWGQAQSYYNCVFIVPGTKPSTW